MPQKGNPKPSYRDRIFETIRGDIIAGIYPVGSKLPSRRRLREKVHASIFPIHQAMVQLEAEGYVERRHGSGVYVRDRPVALGMADSAMLCIQATGHVYGELNGLLHNRLHDLGLFAATLDIVHGNAAALLRRAQYSLSRFIIMNAGGSFPFEALEAAALARKHAIAVLRWESEMLTDQVHRILVDHAAASVRLAKHLWDSGHRHVLFTGPDNMIWCANQWDGTGSCPHQWNVQCAGFVALWRQHGGTLSEYAFNSDTPTSTPRHEDPAISVILRRVPKPTAIVGLRDVDAMNLREAVRTRDPSTQGLLLTIGNGDTPWSQASSPPFSSLNWNLDALVDAVCGLIRDLEAGKSFEKPVLRLVAPRLVVR